MAGTLSLTDTNFFPPANGFMTGGGFIVLAATLSTVGNLPVAGLALIFGIDRFMSEARALTNLIGNGVATVVVGTWCGQVDVARMQQVLDRQSPDQVVAAGQVIPSARSSGEGSS